MGVSIRRKPRPWKNERKEVIAWSRIRMMALGLLDRSHRCLFSRRKSMPCSFLEMG